MMSQRKQLTCLFCMKKVEAVEKKQKDGEITEGLLNSCFTYLPSSVIGNPQKWAWEEFKRNNGPFCTSCLHHAKQLSTKSELVVLVQKEMTNFVDKLTTLIIKNRNASINAPFYYKSGIQISVKGKPEDENEDYYSPPSKVNEVPIVAATPEVSDLGPAEDSYDCYEEEIYESEETRHSNRNQRDTSTSAADAQTPEETPEMNETCNSPPTIRILPLSPSMKTIVLQTRASKRKFITIPCKCGMTFENSSDLMCHKSSCPAVIGNSAAQRTQESQIRYRCGKCGFLARTLQELGEHKILKHTNNYICKKCGEEFNQRIKLRTHMKIHRDPDGYRCPYVKCLRVFKSKTILTMHELKFHEEGNGDVTVVDEDNYDEEEMRRNKEKRICAKCGLLCNTKTHLNYHIISKHSDEMPHECPVCKRRFKIRNFLKNHMQTHMKVKNYLCASEGCSKSFAREAELQNHKKLEHSKDHFECQLCGFKTLIEKKLKIHRQRYHDPNKKFVCQVCGKRVSSNTVLLSHERIHTGEKPYKCPDCEEGFRTTIALTIHKNRQHATAEQKFKCPSCDYVAGTSFLLSAHSRVHSENKPYKCINEGCGKFYKTKATMITHSRLVCKHKLQNTADTPS